MYAKIRSSEFYPGKGPCKVWICSELKFELNQKKNYTYNKNTNSINSSFSFTLGTMAASIAVGPQVHFTDVTYKNHSKNLETATSQSIYPTLFCFFHYNLFWQFSSDCSYFCVLLLFLSLFSLVFWFLLFFCFFCISFIISEVKFFIHHTLWVFSNCMSSSPISYSYWAIQRSWFARVNGLCNLSWKKSQECTLPGRFLSRHCFTLCITVEVEPRITKQYKCQYSCSCKNYHGEGIEGKNNVSLRHFLADQKIASS